MKNSPQPIGDILKHVVADLSRAKKQDIHKIAAGWPAIAGKGLSRHSRPVSLKQGTLRIAIDESSWLYQADLEQMRLLKAVQKKIGKEKIQNIQFGIGKVS